MKKFTREEILTMLRSSEIRQEGKALTFLHRTLYKKALHLINKFSGSKEDAEDVFQESLTAFFKMTKTNRLPSEFKLEHYILGMCKNIWWKKLRKKSIVTEGLSEISAQIPIEDIQLKTIINDDQAHLMKVLRSKLGEGCYQMMVYFYYERRRMKEIAQLFNYESEQVAKNRKSRCLKKLKTILEASPILKKAFI